MPVTDLPIIGYYNQQRFKQFDPSDTANWYLVPDEIGKKKMAMYPTMGRRHISFLNQNRLIFAEEPRAIFKSINYWYAIVEDTIFRVDRFFNQVEISEGKLTTISGDVFFTYLVSGDPAISGNTTFACFTDGQHIYIYDEVASTFELVTDSNAPKNPLFIATFGNRIVASGRDSSTFILSIINLGGNSFDPSTCFTVDGSQVFAQEIGPIRQMGVLQNTLYIFTDYTTGIWSNIRSTQTAGTGTVDFPWKKNATYDWDFGMADPATLDIDFGMIVWLAQNRNGIIQVMASTGQKPQEISTKAIDVLLQRTVNAEANNPALMLNADGFLYDYENTIFYRLSSGVYTDSGILDNIDTASSIEYNFETQTWHRCIEKNGERNRIQDHIFFMNRHLVTVEGDGTVYEMSGQYYTNDIENPDQDDRQATDAYLTEPFRYERITPNICAGMIDVIKSPGYYAEFITDYVEIDFVWGEETFLNSTVPFPNAIYIVDEEPDENGDPVYLVSEDDDNAFIISEQGNYPVLNSSQYHTWFKPHIELYFSDDGGISFLSADVREFSQIGVYQWRMRWYELGTSRNRVYKLICVSPAPIVILGGSMSVRNSSGGAA